MTTPALLRPKTVDRQLERFDDHLKEVESLEVTVPGGVSLTPGDITAVRAAVGDALTSPKELDGVVYSRSPVVSALQSALHDGLELERTLGLVTVEDEDRVDPFADRDIRWIGNTALSVIGRALKGSHPFCDKPAELELAPRARLVLLSDWGTGRAHAPNVAAAAAQHLDSNLDVHVVHLGDIYYTGTRREARANFLDRWPVSAGQDLKAGSWALNGNHEMYSGGYGLFETVLSDPRFARQWADGSPTSLLHFKNEHWQVLGLDTAWKNNLIEVEDRQLRHSGQVGHLYGSQLERIADCASDHQRRLLLLSHHQLFSAYDDEQGETVPMADELADTLAQRPVDVWFWGHEHDCLGYHEHGGVRAARAIGHGAVPRIVQDAPEPLQGAQPSDPPRIIVPDPSEMREGHPLRSVAWEYRDYREYTDDDKKWAKHGFAVVDLDGPDMQVRYFDDEGSCFWQEEL